MNYRKIFFILLFLPVHFSLQAQIDKEFWFVAPEASSIHGDSPTFIRISTMDDPANITLRMPANNKFVPVHNLIPPNTTFSFRLDNIGGDPSWLDSTENRPPDRVLNKGFLLTTDKYVTAYYEINNASNPGIFPLKGKNGLGLEFFIPGQTNYANHAGSQGTEAFDIVATEDLTTITITPSIDIIGHEAHVPFQIVLNKGETYSARTTDMTAPVSLAGSHVVADKPIAITISDDSIITGGWDIIGDQLVPVHLLGKEYIVIKGFADNTSPNNNDERVYILAVQDGTDVFIDGSPTPAATLNAGTQYNHAIAGTSNTVYIKTSKPVYAYHLSGHPGEAGASILPQDSCTGSRKMGFNRSSASAFAMLILTRNGNEGAFLLNGGNTVITSAGFSAVPGTGGNWMFFRQNNMTTTSVPLGANLLENTSGKFHLGILNNVGASSEYGYYSDFSTLNLGVDANMCMNDSIVLDGGPFRTSYEWKKLIAGAWTTIGTQQFYTCHDTGSYACITNGDFCTLADTIHVGYYPNATVSLGADQEICQGTSITLTPGNYQSYFWSDGSAQPTLTTGNEGKIWVRVVNNNDCVASDTMMLQVDSLPLANQTITGPDTVCQGVGSRIYTIPELDYATSYLWTLPTGWMGSSDSNSIAVDFPLSAVTGEIRVKGVNDCGMGDSVSMTVVVKPLPAPAGLISAPAQVCQGSLQVAVSVEPIAHALSYTWSLPPGFSISGGSNQSILVDVSAVAAGGVITVHGNNTCGTGAASSKNIDVLNLPGPAGAISGNTMPCQGVSGINYSISAIPSAESYLWELPSGFSINAGAGTSVITITVDSSASPGTITVKGHNSQCGDGLPANLFLNVLPLPSPAGTVSGPSAVCQGETNVSFTIAPLTNTTGYVWSFPPGTLIQTGGSSAQPLVSFNTLAISGNIQVQGINMTCGLGRKSNKYLVVNPLPSTTGAILGPAELCQETLTGHYQVEIADPGTTSYQWTLLPPASGVLSGASATVQFLPATGFTGAVTLMVNGINGCGSGPVSAPKQVIVHPLPVVSFTLCSDMHTTKNSRPVTLKGGSPALSGGQYSGPGVSLLPPSTWVFDPGVPQISGSTSGTPYNIIYTYTNIYNCSKDAVQIIKVYPSNASSPCPGTVTDPRDGQSYQTIQVGYGTTAKCWMRENLNYGQMIPFNQSQSDNCVREKYCRENLEANCNSEGGLYQWYELMDYQESTNNKGICPPGWHVPSLAEWQWLIDSQATGLAPPSDGLAGGFLQDSLAINGFSVLAKGIILANNTKAHNLSPDMGTMFWTSTQAFPNQAYARGIHLKNPSVSKYTGSWMHAFPVRCIKD